MGTRKRNEERVLADIHPGRTVAAFASLGAAAIHLAATPDHYAEWWLAGVFFAVVGVFQAGWTVIALRTPGPFVMSLGLLGNAGVAVVWALSRTTGIPAGPAAGQPEGVGQAGITAVAFEAVVCVVAVWHLRRRNASGFASSLRAVLLVGAAGALVTGMTMPAVEGALSHSHGHGHGAEAVPHGDDGSDSRGEAGDPTCRPSSTPRPGGSAPEEPATPGPSGSGEQPGQQSGESHGHEDEPHAH